MFQKRPKSNKRLSINRNSNKFLHSDFFLQQIQVLGSFIPFCARIHSLMVQRIFYPLFSSLSIKHLFWFFIEISNWDRSWNQSSFFAREISTSSPSRYPQERSWVAHLKRSPKARKLLIIWFFLLSLSFLSFFAGHPPAAFITFL